MSNLFSGLAIAIATISLGFSIYTSSTSSTIEWSTDGNCYRVVTSGGDNICEEDTAIPYDSTQGFCVEPWIAQSCK